MRRRWSSAAAAATAALALVAGDAADAPTASPTLSESPAPQQLDTRPLASQLFDAIQAGDEDYLELVLAAEVDVNAVHSSGNTALSLAITNNEAEMVRMLVRAGAAVPSPFPDLNYLALAATYSSSEIVNFLITNGCDPNGAYPASFVFEVSTVVQVETTVTPSPALSPTPGQPEPAPVIEVSPTIVPSPTVDDPASVDLEAWVGVPLVNAASVGNVPALVTLVERGADLNTPVGENGELPLTAAAAAGHFDLVQYMIEYGADPRAELVDGSTARDIAAARGHTEIVAYLDLIAGGPAAADG